MNLVSDLGTVQIQSCLMFSENLFAYINSFSDLNMLIVYENLHRGAIVYYRNIFMYEFNLMLSIILPLLRKY